MEGWLYLKGNDVNVYLFIYDNIGDDDDSVLFVNNDNSFNNNNNRNMR